MRVDAHSVRHLLAVLVVSLVCFPAFGCALFSGQESPTPAESAGSTDGTDGVGSTEVAESADGVDILGDTDGAESAESADSIDSVESVERTDAQPFVGDTIEMNYDPNVIMKRAEAFHEQEGYAEAIVEYRHFLELHNTHVLAPYAQYRLALSHFKMVGTIDVDVTPVQVARAEFEKLMEDFPDSKYEAEALASIRECDRHLAQHHMFIGKFYYRKEAYMGALQRFMKVVDASPDLEEAVEAELYLAKTYNEMGALEWARDWAQALVQQHPQHDLRDEGLQLLTALYDEHPDLADTAPRNRHTLLARIAPDLVPAPEPAPEPVTVTRSTSKPSGTIRTTSVLAPQAGFHFTATGTSCQVGSWCEGMGTPPYGTPTPQDPVIPSRTCRPGAWCE